jgi:hypothetical protein
MMMRLNKESLSLSFLSSLLLIIIPALLHIHPLPPRETCGWPDQAAHYHNLGPSAVWLQSGSIMS